MFLLLLNSIVMKILRRIAIRNNFPQFANLEIREIFSATRGFLCSP